MSILDITYITWAYRRDVGRKDLYGGGGNKRHVIVSRGGAGEGVSVSHPTFSGKSGIDTSNYALYCFLINLSTFIFLTFITIR